jgi:hypothetical protein
MTQSRKTDNANLRSKLDLRRYFLRRYHAKEKFSVLDCCSGSGIIWRQLRQEFQCDYWGVDIKPARGKIKIDSIRILAQAGWEHNVIDVDTYGSPWKHWQALLPRITKPTTVFMTWGQVAVGGGNMDRTLLKAVGMEFKRLSVPNCLACKVAGLGVNYLLSLVDDFDLRIVEAREAEPGPHARYFGVHLTTATTSHKGAKTLPSGPHNRNLLKNGSK